MVPRLPFPGRRRGPQLPPEELARLGLGPRERVLAAAPVTGGGWVVATRQALHLPGVRLPWVSIVHAAWERADDALVVETIAGEPGVAAQTRRLLLDAPGHLPAVVRERVMASIVVSQRAQLTPDAGVRVVARRVPQSSELAWQLVLDAGLDPADPALAAAAQEALREVRNRTGL